MGPMWVPCGSRMGSATGIRKGPMWAAHMGSYIGPFWAAHIGPI